MKKLRQGIFKDCVLYHSASDWSCNSNLAVLTFEGNVEVMAMKKYITAGVSQSSF